MILKKLALVSSVLGAFLLAGCASVPTVIPHLILLFSVLDGDRPF